MKTLRALLTAVCVSVLVNCAAPANAIFVVLNETFDNDSGFTKADADPTATSFFVSDNGDQYWGIIDPVGATDDYDLDPDAPPDGSPAYTGFSGNYLHGENIGQPGDSHTLPLSLTWSNLDISGLVDLMFSGLFAAQNPAEFESTDFLKIQYRIDSDVGAFTELFWFSADGDPGGNNDELAFDSDADGTVDGATLSTTAASFSKAITGTGSTLDLRVLMSSNANDEAFAFDSFMVTGVPEPSAFLFGGLVCGVIGLAAMGRRFASGPSIDKAS
jgi:hypothetical protein